VGEDNLEFYVADLEYSGLTGCQGRPVAAVGPELSAQGKIMGPITDQSRMPVTR
jgi:hypothetical protein